MASPGCGVKNLERGQPALGQERFLQLIKIIHKSSTGKLFWQLVRNLLQ